VTTLAPDADTLLLKPARGQHLLLLATCAAFVAIGVMMIRDGDLSGWFVAGFFGLCVVVFSVNLIPGASYLLLAPEGFRYRSLFRAGNERWRDIERFGVFDAGARTMVGWDYVAGYERHQRGRHFAKRLAGLEAGLPDTYGRSATELAELLDDWRRRALQSERGAQPGVD